MHRPRICMIAISLCILSFFSVACSGKSSWQTVSNSNGDTMSWTTALPAVPAATAVPQIGDLLHVESVTAASVDPFLTGPDGVPIFPLRVEFSGVGKKTFWSFRIQRSGDWSWTTGEESKKIFSVATVADKATELKKVDAASLWSGRSGAKK